MTEQSSGGRREAEAAQKDARPKARRRKRRAAAGGRRCERNAPGPGSRRAKAPRAPQCAKRARPTRAATRRRYSASAWATRAMWARVPQRSRSAPEARRRYYRSIEGKGGLRLCPSALSFPLSASDLHPWASLSVADIAGVATGGSTPARYRRAPATHQQRGYAPAQQPQRATGLLNGVPVRTSLVCRSFVRAQPSFT